ncbi:DUF6708 domain-containing protein [Luteimonas sp. A537]
MFHAGLVWKYKVDRALSEDEHALRLEQRTRLDVEPADEAALVRMNSTFLESVDKYFFSKGWLSLVGLLAIAIGLGLMGAMAYAILSSTGDAFDGGRGAVYLELAAAVVVLSLPIAAGLFLLKYEMFRLTHYPIRLDRRQRMVHAFRQDKSILSVPWDEVFFTLARENSRPGAGMWEIQGHVLDDDGSTVRETFAFSSVSDQDILRRHWEFLRRYMEDGPQDLVARVKMYAAVDQRKETWWEGFMRIAADEITMAPLAAIVFAPFTVLQASARWLAMRSCTIPRWPAHIEAACRVDPDDAWARDAHDQVVPRILLEDRR